MPENTPPDCNKELYELYFVFAAVWAFGGAMFQDQVCDLCYVFFVHEKTTFYCKNLYVF